MNQNFDYTPQDDRSFFGQDPFVTPPKKSNGHALASLWLGIASLAVTCLCCCLYYLAAPLSILSIVMAVLAKKRNNGTMPGPAVAGLILAIVGLLIFICMLGYELLFLISTTNEEIRAMILEYVEDYMGMSFKEYIEEIMGSVPTT